MNESKRQGEGDFLVYVRSHSREEQSLGKANDQL